MTSASIDRWRGCLIGECLGDALGFPVEGQHPVVCAAYVQADLGRRGRGPYAFGQYSDDSQLARELLQSYVERGAFDPADYGRRIAAIFVEERIVGRGTATQNAAMRITRGARWDEAGESAPSAGNGSAMRAGPVGLLCARDPAALVRMAVDQGRITHQDPRCNAGSVAIAGAVAIALRGELVDVPAFCAELASLTAPVDASVAQMLGWLPGWCELPPDRAVQHVAGLGDYATNWHGISPFVTSSVAWSLYSFLRSPDDYLATISTAIAVGGDVDTTAAMAGAISGARLGRSGLPDDLARQVNDQGTWRHDELVALVDRAFEVSRRGRAVAQ